MKEVRFSRAIWVVINVFNNFSQPKSFKLYCQLLIYDSSFVSNDSLAGEV
jgi:hypothetical protein